MCVWFKGFFFLCLHSWVLAYLRLWTSTYLPRYLLGPFFFTATDSLAATATTCSRLTRRQIFHVLTPCRYRSTSPPPTLSIQRLSHQPLQQASEMGAVVSCVTPPPPSSPLPLTPSQIKSVFQTIGSVLMAIVNGIGAICQAIISGIVSLFDIIISCLTCGRSGRRARGTASAV